MPKKVYRRKSFERLPNEILIEIFAYLNGVDIINSFSKLNIRFEHLLNTYCRYFDLKSIGKKQFDYIYQSNYFKQCKSLQISDDDHTHDFVNYFFTLNYQLNQLESLSIRNLNFEKNYLFLSQISSFENLVCLRIENICGNSCEQINLPNLNKLILSSCSNFSNWIEHFSQIESLEFTSISLCKNHLQQSPLKWPSRLKYLKIIFKNDFSYESIFDSLVHLSSLINLEIYQTYPGISYPDGFILENLIRSSLPSLKTLRFYFQFISFIWFVPDEYKQMIDSFSSSFYLDERKWFICHDIPQKYSSHIILLNAFQYAFQNHVLWKNSFQESLTSVQENLDDKFYLNIYKQIQTVHMRNENVDFSRDFRHSPIVNFYLDINCKITARWLRALTKLRHLQLDSHAIISSKDFQNLLMNSPHLNSLFMSKTLLRELTKQWTNQQICEILSKQIQILDLLSNSYPWIPLSDNEVAQIVRIFQINCQHLSLPLKLNNDNQIDFILKNMTQLSSLHIKVIKLKYQTTNNNFHRFNAIVTKKHTDLFFWI